MAREKSKKLPAFQFYPGDWRKDIAVQSLEYHDRGVWFEMVLLMHDSEERGKLVLNGIPMTEETMARLLGLDSQTLNRTLTTLLTRGVASRDEADGAIICRRMVRDERLRKIRQQCGELGGNPNLVNQKSKQNPTTQVKQSSTPSSSSSSSPSVLKDDCSALDSAAPIVPGRLAGTLPLNDGTDYEITEDAVTEWSELYPAVDVKQQLRNMKGWFFGNPKNRKTRSGINRTIHNWLKTEQNKAPRVNALVGGNSHGDYESPAAARMRRSRDAIRQAAERLGLGASANDDRSDAGELSVSGATTGDSRIVDGRMVRNGKGVRFGEVPPSTHAIADSIQVLSPPF